MNTNIEVTGRTVEEAIEIALGQLGVERDQVEIDVISQGKGGILGFGAEPAKIKVTLSELPQDLETAAKIALDNLLRSMGVSASATIRSSSGSESIVEMDIEGEDSGLLIGRRGETLRALQFMVNIIIGRRDQGRIILDVEGYKERRYASLRALAGRVADRVTSTKQPITLEPMSANERRAVHMALEGNPKVTTESTGLGESRKVTIFPSQS